MNGERFKCHDQQRVTPENHLPLTVKSYLDLQRNLRTEKKELGALAGTPTISKGTEPISKSLLLKNRTISTRDGLKEA